MDAMEIWIASALFLAAFLFLGSRLSAASSSRSRDAARLATIERKLDLIMRRLEIEDPVPDTPDVIGHLMQGQKIQAIKAYREQTGATLLDAKNAVEKIARDRGLE
jgi:hypothetical protein